MTAATAIRNAKRMAQPEMVDPRYHSAITRFTHEEVRRINAHCTRFKIPRAALLREAALLAVEDAERNDTEGRAQTLSGPTP